MKIAKTVGPIDGLASIEAEGRALENEQLAADVGLAPELAGPPAPTIDVDKQAAEIWAMVPATIGSVLAIGMPELKAVYSDEACAAWGAAMVPLAKKYGWHIGPDSPELGVLVASAPFVAGTGVVMMQRRRAPPRPPQGPPMLQRVPAVRTGNPLVDQAGLGPIPQLNEQPPS
jgi:hypothetical protein